MLIAALTAIKSSYLQTISALFHNFPSNFELAFASSNDKYLKSSNSLKCRLLPQLKILKCRLYLQFKKLTYSTSIWRLSFGQVFSERSPV